ncbi:unnamed protein product, partial [marine sediment metagenome]
MIPWPITTAPPKRRVTGVNEWITNFAAQRIGDQKIEALWVEDKPIYTLENLSAIFGAFDADQNLLPIVNAAGEITTANGADIVSNIARLR